MIIKNSGRFVASLVLVSTALSSTGAFAGGFIERIIQQKMEKAERLLESSSFNPFEALMQPSFGLIPGGAPAAGTTAVRTFVQKLNSFDPAETRTFNQRYFIDSTSASGPDAPVFYYICGEGTCEGPNGAALSYARQYRGTIVALEHRFYGSSLPFPTLSADNLRYLSAEHALADLANFEAYAQAELGLKGKWIAIGGSYSGSLAAYYREKYPNLVVGALSSSGPVQARENFELYDYVVADRSGPECSAQIRAVVGLIENQLKSDPAAFAQTKAKFQSTQVNDPGDFLYIVADMAAMAVQYGQKDPFCQTILAGKDDPIGAYAKAGMTAFQIFNLTPFEDSFQYSMNLDPQAYSEIGSRQWMYQSCTEFGYFQNAYHDPEHSARSQMINPAFHQHICQVLFGTPPLNADRVNQELYAPLLQPAVSHILFTNGSVDPWATLSISPSNGNAVNPNTAAFMIDGAAHCGDLSTPHMSDSAALKQSRTIFTGLLNQWL